MKTHLFHVTGLHCASCVLLTEGVLGDVPGVKAVKTDLAANTIEVIGDFGGKDAAVVAKELSEVLAKHGYALSVGKPAPKKAWGEFSYAVPAAAAFVVAFVALQKAGLVNLVTSDEVSYGAAFLIGVIASLSTCMAVVGGLLLSMSATYAKHGDTIKPHLLFHVGRIVAFFVLGGVIGAVGTTFRLGGAAVLAVSLLMGLVMLVLGLNLLDVFDWAKRLQPAMPKFLSKRALGVSAIEHSLAPLAVGVATFFLPCGFTQSMQLYTLTTGGFMAGGLTMLSFALGTLPVLALISFGAFSIDKSAHRGVFFKAAGIIVILFALFNMMNGLVAAGYLPPLLSL